MKFKAAIFDMDGLLIDSEIYWGKAEVSIWKQLGFSDAEKKEIEKKILGLNMKDTVAVIQATHPHLSPERIRSVFNDAAQDIYKKQANLLPGAAVLLERIKAEHVPAALASSSSKDWVQMFLEKFNLTDYFIQVFSTEGLDIKGKPAPDVYELCIKTLGVPAQDVVVFEDTTVGLAAGKGGGASVIAVPDARWSFGDFSSADLIADTLEDKRIFEFLGLPL